MNKRREFVDDMSAYYIEQEQKRREQFNKKKQSKDRDKYRNEYRDKKKHY